MCYHFSLEAGIVLDTLVFRQALIKAMDFTMVLLSTVLTLNASLKRYAKCISWNFALVSGRRGERDKLT